MNKLKWLGVSLIVILLDQFTKCWAMDALALYHPKTIFSFFNLTLAYNKGAAFSFLNTPGHWQNSFFIVVTVMITLALLVWLKKLKQNERLELLSLSFVLGGALGNLIDRFHYGYVIDFLEFHVKSHYWPVFNIADSAICVGAALLLLTTLRKKN